MNRTKRFGLVALLMVIAVFISACTPQQKIKKPADENISEDGKAYREATENFTPVTIKEAQAKQEDGDEFYLYIGDETCEYCVDFVMEFSPVIEKHDLEVIYLDYYANADDKELDSFIDEHGLETIPAVLRATEDGFEHIKIQSPYSQRRIEAWFGLNE